MSSKHSVLRLILALSFSLVGCNLQVGEDSPQKRPLEIPSGKYNCLSEVGKTVEKYFQAKLNEKQIKEFVGCVRIALNSFEYYTRGENETHYKPKEIVDFLHKYFLKEATISNRFLAELMILKRNFFGGTSHTISRDEFKSIVRHAEFFEKQLLRLNPHMKYLNLEVGKRELQKNPHRPDLESARQALLETAKEYGDFFDKSQQSFDLNSVETYLDEFKAFIGWEKVRIREEVLPSKNWADLIRSFKAVMTSPDKETIKPGEWGPTLTAAVNWYYIVARYQYQISKEPLSYGQGLDDIAEVVGIANQSFRDAIAFKENNEISYETLNDLAESLEGVNWIPFSVRAESVKVSLPIFFGRVMGDPAIPASKRVSTGVVAYNMDQIELEFDRWYGGQKFFNNMILKQRTRPSETVWERLNPVGAVFKNMEARLWKADHYFSTPRFDTREMQRIIKNIPPMFKPGESRMYVVPQDERAEYGLAHFSENLTYMNTIRAVIRLLFRGWNEEPQRTRDMVGIREFEMSKFYDQVIELGADLNFMDPRRPGKGPRTFMEGNLFTSSGDGVEMDWGGPTPLVKGSDRLDKSRLLTFEEGIELLAFVYSGGQARDLLYDDLLARCSQQGKKDLHGRPKILTTCLQEKLATHYSNYFSNLPGMVSYIRALDEEARQSFMRKLVGLSRGECSVAGWSDSGEASAVTTVMHYIESLMNQFDKNKDGKLGPIEMNRAYKRFGGFINKEAQIARLKARLKDGYIDKDAPLEKWYTNVFGEPEKFKMSLEEYYDWSLFREDSDQGWFSGTLGSIADRIVDGEWNTKENEQQELDEDLLEDIEKLKDSQIAGLSRRAAFMYIVNNGSLPQNIFVQALMHVYLLGGQGGLHINFDELEFRLGYDRADFLDVLYTLAQSSAPGVCYHDRLKN